MEWRDIEAAQCFVSLAIKCGLREQGLQVLMARGLLSWGSIRMEVPWCDSNRIMLSKEYVRFPVDLVHRKIGRELERFLIV